MNLRDRPVKKAKDGDLIYGCVSGFEVGRTWRTREELSNSWVHRPKSANFHAGARGVYSVLINSKHRGVDNGLTITYASPKLRDCRKIGLYNKSLIKNCQLQNPIRLVRGVKPNSIFAPEAGFRFDGLYKVDKYWKDNENIYFRFKRLEDQPVAPWVSEIPQILSTSSPSVAEEMQDDDITPFTSNIRFQSRSVAGPKQWKREIEEDNSTRSSYGETTRSEISNNNTSTQTPEVAEDSNCSPTDSINHQLSNFPESPPPEEQADFDVQPQLVGGMPAPKICDVFKEEVTTFSGLVVTETVPQLENDDEFYESVYEEEPEEVTELGSDVDFGEEEEVEVDSKFIEDVGGSQIVTAISLSQTSPPSSQMQNLELTSEIDIEDGPKFAHIIAGNSDLIHNNLAPNETSTSPSISNFGTVQRVSLEDTIKVNYDSDDDNEELVQPVFRETETNQVETKGSECLYIYPGTKCENDNDVEKAILNGNFQWYQGNRPLQKTTKLTSYTLHEYEERLVEATEPEASIITDDFSQDVSEIHIENNAMICEPLTLPGQKPDSTSQVAINRAAEHCRTGSAVCPYKDITLGELVAYAVNQPLDGCMCLWEKHLPSMKYCVDQILRARQSHDIASIQGIEKEQIMAAPSDGQDKLGEISCVQSLAYAGCSYDWNNKGGTGVTNFVPNFEVVSVGEEESGNQSEEENLQDPLDVPTSLLTNSPPNSTTLSNAEMLWKGLGEIRAEAQRRGSKSQDSNSSINDVSQRDEESLTSEEDETTREIAIKSPKKRKNVFLNGQYRKRKHSNLSVGDEMDQSQKDVMHQQHRRPLVRLRSTNLQSKLTSTRVIHINNNQSGLTSAVKEASNISLGDKQKVIDLEAEHGVSNTGFESCTENVTPRYLISPTNDCASDEVNIADDFDIEIIEDLRYPKRSEGTISTNVLSSVSKKEKGKQSAKKRALEKPNQLIAAKDVEEIPSSIDLPIIYDVTSLPKDNTEKRSKTPTPYLDIYLTVQESDDGVIAASRLSSPSSDTASFDRVCNELCEGLPSSKQENWESKKALPGGDIKKKRRPRSYPASPYKALKELQLPSVTPKKYVPSRLNNARNLKGFTNEDMKEMKRRKEILDDIIEEHLIRKSSSNTSSTVSKNKQYTAKKSDLILRPKSTRLKQKVASDSIYF